MVLAIWWLLIFVICSRYSLLPLIWLMYSCWFFYAEYSEENPKMVTKCEHDFHLCCILEWMERSETCPVCDKVFLLFTLPFQMSKTPIDLPCTFFHLRNLFTYNAGSGVWWRFRCLALFQAQVFVVIIWFVSRSQGGCWVLLDMGVDVL